MIGLPDEVSVHNNESIYVHDFVDQRAYVTKTCDSSTGYLPCHVIDFQNESELNTSFNELALAEEAADPSSPPRQAESQELPRPNPDFIKLKPKLKSARRFAFRESPTFSSPDLNLARASDDELETSSLSSRLLLFLFLFAMIRLRSL